MESALILSETVFYFTASAAIIAIGVLCAIIAHHLLRIARELEALSLNFHEVSSEVGERIRDIVNRLSDLPILSYFLKRHLATDDGKGRGKASKK